MSRYKDEFDKIRFDENKKQSLTKTLQNELQQSPDKLTVATLNLQTQTSTSNNHNSGGGNRRQVYKISAIVLVAVIVLCAIFIPLGLLLGKHTTPIFLGMEVLQNSPVEKYQSSLQNFREQNNISGDLSDNNISVNQDFPFGQANTVEGVLAKQTDTEGVLDIDYYALANQDIFIQIRIHNPDDFEILSFTLNGKKYQSYQFLEGSDGQNIVLRVTAPNKSCIEEFTIDAIKYVDGKTINDVIIEGKQTIKVGVGSVALVSTVENLNVGKNSVNFNLQIYDDADLLDITGGFLKVAIYNGSRILSSNDLKVGQNKIAFNNLQANTLYQIVVYGVYDDLDGLGAGLNFLEKRAFYTESVVLFDAEKIDITLNSISFDFAWHKDAVNKNIFDLQLYKGDTFVENLTEFEAKNLYSGTKYTVVGSYINLAGEVKSISITFETLSKTVPQIEIVENQITSNSISFGLKIEDEYKLAKIDSIELYKGDEVVKTTTASKLKFTGLSSDTAYSIVVTYSFDLGDEVGVQSSVATFEFETTVELDVLETTTANTAPVALGETVVIEIKLNNPQKVTILDVVINGMPLVPLFDKNDKLYFEIVIDETYEGGATEFIVEKINYKYNDKLGSVTVAENNIATPFINGELEAVSITYADLQFNEIYTATNGNDYYVVITLNNKSNYNVDSIKLSCFPWELNVYDEYDREDIIRLDRDNFAIMVNGVNWDSQSYHVLTSLTYSSNTMAQKTKSFASVTNCIMSYASTEVQLISTASELMNISEYGRYVLTNDIDLDGIDWRRPSFNGVLDGNGYAIKNLSIVESFVDEAVNVGLFASAAGEIKNLQLINPLIIVTQSLKEDLIYEQNYRCHVGFITARAGVRHGNGKLTLSNIQIDGGAISVTSNSYDLAVGGLVGNIEREAMLQLNNCKVDVDINVNGNNSYVGGLVGIFDAYYGNLNIQNCISSGTIVINQLSEHNQNRCFGGLVGRYYDANSVKLENSISTCVIKFENSLQYNLISRHDSTASLKNCFGLDDADLIDFCSESWVKENLGWGSDVWKFSEGELPTLKLFG